MFNLDLSEVEESQFDLLPVGVYTVNLVEAEVKDTKAGDGQYINCKFKVIGGPHDGRFLFKMFNIKNRNPTAVNIGMSQLKSLMLAGGATKLQLSDVNELCGLIVDAAVGKSTSHEFGDRNEIKGFSMTAMDVKTVTVDEIPF